MTVIPEDLDAIQESELLSETTPDDSQSQDNPDSTITLLGHIPSNETAIRRLLVQHWKLANDIYTTAVLPLLEGRVYSKRTLRHVVDTATATILQNIIDFQSSELNDSTKRHLGKLFDKFEENDPESYLELIDSGFYQSIRETTRKILKKES